MFVSVEQHENGISSEQMRFDKPQGESRSFRGIKSAKVSLTFQLMGNAHNQSDEDIIFPYRAWCYDFAIAARRP